MNPAENSIITWLSHLQVLMPPESVTLVGAGNGHGEWTQWLLQQASSAPQITLVEADARQFAALQRTVAESDSVAQRCRLINKVVAPQDGPVSFFVASSQAESGLLAPESLHAVWPNLQAVEVQQREAIGLECLLVSQPRQIAHSGQPRLDSAEGQASSQWLWLDCLPAGKLLDKAADRLASIDVIIARVLLDTQQSAETLEMAQADAGFVQSLLESKGLARITLESTRHPAIGYALFVRDMRAALRNQEAQHKKEQQQAAQKALQLTQAHTVAERLLVERQAQIEQLQQARVEGEKQKQELAQQAAQLSKKHDEQVKLTQECRAQIERLTQAKVTAEKQSQECAQQLAQTKAMVEKQAQEHAQQVEQLRNKLAQERQEQISQFTTSWQENISAANETTQKAINTIETKLRDELNKKLMNSVKQIESFINIQNFFTKNDFLPDFHGWPISPDMGIFILNKIKQQHYDLIIEFGSGTSTILLAKAIELMNGNASQNLAADKPRRTEIVTFDHNQIFYKKTQEMLQARGLEDYVNLIHSPLVSWKENDTDYLYYDCHATLFELAKIFQKENIKILVLVDGPPGTTCKNARYPAIPHVFNYLGKHRIDIILDDANRPEEKATIDLWRSFFKSHSVQTVDTTISSEKGIYFSNGCAT